MSDAMPCHAYLLFGSSNVFFKNLLAASSSRWHSTRSTVQASDRLHRLVVVGGILLVPPDKRQNSSMSFSVGKAMRSTTPCAAAVSASTTSSVTNPSPQLHNRRFRPAKNTRPLPPARSTTRRRPSSPHAPPAAAPAHRRRCRGMLGSAS